MATLRVLLDRWGLMGLASWDLPDPQGPLPPDYLPVGGIEAAAAKARRVSTDRVNRVRKWINTGRTGNRSRVRKVSLPTADKKVAVERATKPAADLIRGEYRAPPPAVRRAADDYITYLKTEGRARRTAVTYRGVLDRFIAYLDRHRVTKLARATAGHFDRYRAERKETRHRKAVYGEGVILKQLFGWAKGRKLIVDNPLAGVRPDKPPTERVIDTRLGHRSDKSKAAVYDRLRDEDSQSFMGKVPFGAGEPAADAGREAG